MSNENKEISGSAENAEKKDPKEFGGKWVIGALALLLVLCIILFAVLLSSLGVGKENSNKIEQIEAGNASSAGEMKVLKNTDASLQANHGLLEGRVTSLEEKAKTFCVCTPKKKVTAKKKVRRHPPPAPRPFAKPVAVAQAPVIPTIREGSECNSGDEVGTYRVINGQLSCLLNAVRTEPVVRRRQQEEFVYEDEYYEDEVYYDDEVVEGHRSSWVPWALAGTALAAVWWDSTRNRGSSSGQAPSGFTGGTVGGQIPSGFTGGLVGGGGQPPLGFTGGAVVSAPTGFTGWR